MNGVEELLLFYCPECRQEKVAVLAWDKSIEGSECNRMSCLSEMFLIHCRFVMSPKSAGGTAHNARGPWI